MKIDQRVIRQLKNQLEQNVANIMDIAELISEQGGSVKLSLKGLDKKTKAYIIIGDNLDEDVLDSTIRLEY